MKKSSDLHRLRSVPGHAVIPAFLSILILIFTFSCEEEFPDLTAPAEFTLTEGEATYNPETMMFRLQVKVEDREAIPVDSVWFELSLPETSEHFLRGPLRDDGTSGDMIPHNGRYSGQFSLDSLAGHISGLEDVTFVVRFSARNSQGEMAEKTVTYSEIFKNYPVTIDTIYAPDTVKIDGGSGDILVFASDSNGYRDIKTVKFRQYSRNDTVTIGENPYFFHLTFIRNESPNSALYYFRLNNLEGVPPGKRTMQFVALDQIGNTDTAYTDIQLVK